MEGNNVVLIPHGRYMLGQTVFKGPCKGHVVFLIVGTLLAPTDIASSVNVDHWISFQYMDRLVIGGGGSLDGRGSSAWPYNSCSKRPDCKPLPPVSSCFMFSSPPTMLENGLSHVSLIVWFPGVFSVIEIGFPYQFMDYQPNFNQ